MNQCIEICDQNPDCKAATYSASLIPGSLLCQIKDTDMATTLTEFNSSFVWYEKQIYTDPGLRNPSFDTDGEHNYCRNPNGKSTIWCQTKTGPNYW